MSQAMNILVCDDSASVRVLLDSVLKKHGYNVTLTDTIKSCYECLKTQKNFDLLLLDVRLPDDNGIDFFAKIRKEGHDIQTIVMTGTASVGQAVQAMRMGALDYISKPLSTKNILAAIENLQSQQVSVSDERYQFVTRSSAALEVEKIIQKISDQNVSVVLGGESGVGKEVYANKIHGLSSRSEGPFVAVNCPAIPDSLFESEVFGHKKGAFTGADRDRVGKIVAADGGTFFLDEVADLNLNAQAKLLRVLQERAVEPLGSNKLISFDVRVICASSKDLKKECQEGRFRSDLYFRLAQMEIRVPSLRERKEDIKSLVEFFAKSYATENHKPTKKFHNSAISFLEKYSWPGNIRELKNIVYRILIMSETDIITEASIPQGLLLESNDLNAVQHQVANKALDVVEDHSLQENEKKVIELALVKNEYNVTKTARELNIGRTTLYRKMKKYGF